MVTLDDGLFNRYAEGVVSRDDCQDKAQDYNGMLLRLKEYDEQQAAEAAEMGADPNAAAGGAPPPPPPGG
jgi:Tfp pilus assembly ATPase PilU